MKRIFFLAGLCLAFSLIFTADGIKAEIRAPARIIVKKAERTLTLYKGEITAAVFCIGLGFSPEGRKKNEGDGATPEGEYYICTRNPKSKFFKSLGLSYPNREDAEEGQKNGLIGKATYERIVKCIDEKTCPPWDTPLGGEIMIHGHGSGSDWTAGCIALNDQDMEVLWRLCPLGTPVTILP